MIDFGRPTPKREFRNGSGGLGTLQIALRFLHLDLTDEGIRGWIFDDISAGMNWYVTSYGRVMSNVIWSKLEGAEAVWIFQLRLLGADLNCSVTRLETASLE